MNILGIIHISFSFIAYLLFFYITLKSFSKKINYKLLLGANLLYIIGFIFGMFWAKIEWGFFINLDIKTILSIAVAIPFVLENITKKNKFLLPLIGTVLILFNYILPVIISSIHTH